MPVTLIAAAAGKNLVIGKDGDLPWHFSADLKYFKQKTMGHPVLMGRVTYQAIVKRLGKPLPGRRNIVLTRDPAFHDERVMIIRAPAEILGLIGKDEWLFVIGGASVYRQTLDLADIVYLTHIEQDIAGDAFFPPLGEGWHLAEEHGVEENGVLLRFCTYRKGPAA